MRIPFVMLMALSVLVSNSRADEGVSLARALEMALGGNHGLVAAGYRASMAHEGVTVARSRYLPKLVLEEGAAASNAPTRVFMMKLDQGKFTSDDFLLNNLNDPRRQADFRTVLSIEMPLLDATLGPGVAVAREGAREQRLERDRFRQETVFKVVAAYLEVQRGKARTRVAAEAVRDAREHLRLATARAKAGAGLRADELRARTFLSDREVEELTASNDLSMARLRLALVTGGTAESLDTSEILGPERFSRPSGDLQAAALASRPELKAMEARQERADALRRQARNQYLPTLYAAAGYEMHDENRPFGASNNAWQAGVSLRWELFDGLRRQAEVGQAGAAAAAVRAETAAARQQVLLEVRESQLRRGEAGKRLEAARHAVLDAEESARLVARRYENSLATLVELLDAQTALNQARATLADSEVAYTLATARVHHATGRLEQEIVP